MCRNSFDVIIDDDGSRLFDFGCFVKPLPQSWSRSSCVWFYFQSCLYTGVPPCHLAFYSSLSFLHCRPANTRTHGVRFLDYCIRSISSLTVTVCHRAASLFVVYLIESYIRTSNRSLYTVIAAFSTTSPLIRHTLERAKRFAQRCHEIALFFSIPWARKPNIF